MCSSFEDGWGRVYPESTALNPDQLGSGGGNTLPPRELPIGVQRGEPVLFAGRFPRETGLFQRFVAAVAYHLNAVHYTLDLSATIV